MKRILLISALLLSGIAAGHSKELPASVRKSVDSLLNTGLRAGHYPGASIAVGDKNGILYQKTYGYRDDTRTAKVAAGDLYDIASLTKVVATTFAVMRLYDEGLVDINKTVGQYISYYAGSEVASIPLSQLLTHTSGLPYIPAYKMLFSNPTGEPMMSRKYDKEKYPYLVERNTYMAADIVGDSLYVSLTPQNEYRRAAENLYINPAVDSLVERNIIDSYDSDLRGRYKYSDTNFYILRQIVERVSGEAFDLYTRKLFDELEMADTGFNPREWRDTTTIIPTEMDYMMRRGLIRGYVHDDLAALNGGVEGNAGVFSTAADLAHFCQMMLNNGTYNGRRIISPATVQLFTSTPLKARKIYRGLGFDRRGPDSDLYNGFGHTGFTGTIIWMDKESGRFMVFLSNRVNPSRVNNGLSSSQLRTKLWLLIK